MLHSIKEFIVKETPNLRFPDDLPLTRGQGTDKYSDVGQIMQQDYHFIRL